MVVFKYAKTYTKHFQNVHKNVPNQDSQRG